MVSFGFAQDNLLTTNDVVALEIDCLSVRPEHRRRAPRVFTLSVVQNDTSEQVLFGSERNENLSCRALAED
jgi:hypothetical protein